MLVSTCGTALKSKDSMFVASPLSVPSTAERITLATDTVYSIHSIIV